MVDSELLKAIYSGMQDMKADMQDMKTDTQTMNVEIIGIKERMARFEVILENETNRNIRLLAENHGSLIDKLNQAIKVSDKTTLYEMQVNILTNKVDDLEKDVADIKNRIA